MEKNEILPLGTIVSLVGSDKKLFIIGVNQKPINKDILYDYCACLHPYGYLNSDDIFLFNQQKIEKIYFRGYEDDESKNYYEDLIWEKQKRGVFNE